MEIYTFTFKMVSNTKNSGSERVAGLTLPALEATIIVTSKSFLHVIEFITSSESHLPLIKVHTTLYAKTVLAYNKLPLSKLIKLF